MQQGKCVGTTDLVRHDLDALLSLFPFEKVGNHSFFFFIRTNESEDGEEEGGSTDGRTTMLY